jgi:hypothetical protein
LCNTPILFTDNVYFPILLNIEQDHTLVKIITTMTIQPLSFINRVARRVSLEKQEVLTLPEHMRSALVFNGVLVARSLVFFVVLCRSLFVDIVFIKNSLKIPKGVIRIRKSKKGRQYNGQTEKKKQWSTKHYTEI